MYSQRNTFWLGMLIAFGLIVSASIASFTAYRIAGSRQSVVVKGLAEKRAPGRAIRKKVWEAGR